MHTHLYLAALDIIQAGPAQNPAAGAGINFTFINTLLGLIGGIVVMVAGIHISHTGKKGKFKDAAEKGGGTMIGIFIFAIGTVFTIASGAFSAFATKLFG